MLNKILHDNQLISLCYVSRSRIDEIKALEEVSDIAIFASSNNVQLSVTGGLLYTVAHFAQVLEGPQKQVEELMSKIEKDPRHYDVTTVDMRPIKRRKFPNWAMAYSGPSPFLDRHIKPLLSPFVTTTQGEELIDSLQERLLRFITGETAGEDAQPTPKLHLVGGAGPIETSPGQEDDRPLI